MFAKYLKQHNTSANLNLQNSSRLFTEVEAISKNKKSFTEVDKLKVIKNLVENFSDIKNKYISLTFLVSIQDIKGELKDVIIKGDFLDKFKKIEDKMVQNQLENFLLGLEDDVLSSLTKEQIESILSYFEQLNRVSSYGYYNSNNKTFNSKSINFNEFDLFIQLNKLNGKYDNYNLFSTEVIKEIVKTLSTKDDNIRDTYFNLLEKVVIESNELYEEMLKEYQVIQLENENKNHDEETESDNDFVKPYEEIFMEILQSNDYLDFFVKPLLFDSGSISGQKLVVLTKLFKTIIRNGQLNDYKRNLRIAVDLADALKSASMLDKVDSLSTEKLFENLELFNVLELKINSETVKHFFIENEGWADRIYNKNVQNTLNSLKEKELPNQKFNVFKSLVLRNFNKKAFLNLLQNIDKEFLNNIEIREKNLLSAELSAHINVNTLNKDTLKTALETVISFSQFTDFAKKYDLKVMTPQEMFFIVDLLMSEYAVKKMKEELYFHFADEKLDERLRLMKALPSNLTYIKGSNLVNVQMFDVHNVIQKMKEKSLNELKAYVSNKHLSKETNLVLFLFKEELPILKEVQKDNNLAFIIQNFNLLKEGSSLNDLQNDFIANSQEVENFKKLLNVRDEAFFDKYFDNLLNFYNNGLVKNSLTYIKSLEGRSYNKQQIENFKLLVKAELAGKLQEVKFDKMDLMKELIMNKIDDELAEKWFKNTKIKEGRFTIKESSDFKTLFEMGEYPVNSCMSFNRGSYNHCLLSIFDSNKKLVTVYDGETLVGRAIVRFTKIKKGNINENGLGFKDIEDEVEVSNTQTVVDENEMNELGIFIERLYTGYDSSQRVVMCDAIVSLMKQKAEDLGVKLYLSSSYSYKGESVYHSSINVFISHSKNGNQYIDSLGGSQDAMSGGRYVKGNAYEIKVDKELSLTA